MNTWISVTDRLPESGVPVLARVIDEHHSRSRSLVVTLNYDTPETAEPNNDRPYSWEVSDSHEVLFGQDVTEWQPIS